MFLNHSKAEIKKMKKSLKIRIVSAILKRLPERAVNNVTYEAEQLAKRHGIKSIFNKVKRKAKKVGRKARQAGRRAKTGITKRTRNKIHRKRNGRTIQISLKRRSRPAWLVKGSPQAKRHMAMIRSKRR